jgi:hypothetical protein
VGHRALHAVPTGDGLYDCYRTRWGGLATFEHPDRIPDPQDSHTPVAEAVDAVGVLDLLEPADEALFVHGDDLPYHVVRLHVPTAASGLPDSPGHTALVPVPDAETARRLDCELRTAKDLLGDAVDAALVPRLVADGYLRVFLARHPDTREVIWLAGS